MGKLLRITRLAGAAAAIAAALSACGGGGGGGGGAPQAAATTTTTTTVSNPPQSTALNQVPVVVEQNPSITTYVTLNVPYVSVKVCDSSGACTTVDHVLLDTGSYGLRLFASALNGISLTPQTVSASSGTATAGQPIGECANFVTSYMWGSVDTATVELAGETAANIPIQVVSDPNFATVPSACSGSGLTQYTTATQLGANGILGVGLMPTDGQNYFACSGAQGTTCQAATPPAEVMNPVAAFPGDNNGVILAMPSVPVSGQATASGVLTFGIDTQGDNSLSGFSVIPGTNFTGTINGQAFQTGFFDSGSNVYFLTQSGIPVDSSNYFAPAQATTLPVTITGSGASAAPYQTSLTLTAQPAQYSLSVNAYSGLGIHLGNTNTIGDFGIPYFYGKSIAYVIGGKAVPEATGPAYAVH